MQDSQDQSAPQADADRRELARAAKARSPKEAAALLAEYPAARIAEVLHDLNPARTQDILAELPGGLVDGIVQASSPALARQWQINQPFGEGTIGRMMEPVRAVFRPDMSVHDTVEQLRPLVRAAFITYGYVTDDAGKLLGLITMRDLLFADNDVPLESIMLRNPFVLAPTLQLADAMKLVLDRHYPVYPVCDANGVLLGLLRGQALFEEQAFEITAQVGSMVGVEKEERLATSLKSSFKFRHPWLQINLATAFIAGAVVAIFQDTVDRLVILALFLPVLAGQSGNTGCQALAVTLRGMTLGELKKGAERALVVKEASLGALNGAFTGVVAALGMFIVATYQHNPDALLLSIVVWVALVGSCVASGISGAMVPLTLKRFGFDPATASSIFLTTATDVVSMGLLLGLAALLI
ncbi:MAG: magnesium transporter [Burkholderiales bacterium]|nr:magnesium transporter [Burkholderiales bacterium]